MRYFLSLSTLEIVRPTFIAKAIQFQSTIYLWSKTKITESPLAIDIQQLLDKTLYNKDNMNVYNKVI